MMYKNNQISQNKKPNPILEQQKHHHQQQHLVFHLLVTQFW